MKYIQNIKIKKDFWKFKGFKLPLIALLGLSFAIYSVLSRPEKEIKEPFVIPPQNQFSSSIAGIGLIEPKSELINVGVEIAGIIREVNVKVGDYVEEGTVLFALDARDIDAQIKVLRSELESAEIQANDANSQFVIVQNVSDKRAVAKDDFNRRKYARQLAFSRVNEIKEMIKQAMITKDRLVVKAPITGKILKVNARIGEYASNPSSLIIIGDTSILHVRVEIDEENASRILPNSEAYGMTRGNPDKKYPLTFVRFEPYIKPKENLAVSGQKIDTRVLEVIYALPQEDNLPLFVGQKMDVFIKE